MNLLFPNEPPFIENAGSHAGRYRGVADGMKCWEVKDPSTEPFKTIIKTIAVSLSDCGIPRSALVLFDLFLQGNDLGSVTVYVRIAGATEKHRKKAVKHLKKGDLLRTYPGLKVAHWDWPPDAPNVTTMGKEDSRSEELRIYYKGERFEILLDQQPRYHNGYVAFTICANADGGVRQSGVLNHRMEIRGHEYLVAPAHIFLPPPADEIEDDSSAEDSDSDSETDFNMLRAGSATPPDMQLVSVSDSVSEETSQRSPSDRAEEDDQETVRRTMVSKEFFMFSPKLDYVLIPMPEDRLMFRKLRAITDRRVKEATHWKGRVTVQSSNYLNVEAASHGRPTMMRLPYSSSFSTVYPLEMDAPVSKGDCGSAVYGQGSSDLLGFIVAGSVEGRVAYMISARDMLQDMETSLRLEEPAALRPRSPPPIPTHSRSVRFSSRVVPKPTLTDAREPRGLDPSSPLSLLEARIRFLPPKTTVESVKLMLLWCNDVASVNVGPLFGDSGYVAALVRFHSQRGPVEVRRMLEGKSPEMGLPLRVELSPDHRE